MRTILAPTTPSLARTVRDVLGIFKLRIGVMIMVTALASQAFTPGSPLTTLQCVVLALSVLVSSAAAGAFNQFYEFESDKLMARTRGRAFATGALAHSSGWLWLFAALLAGSVLATWTVINAMSALYVFLGAFTYAVVYTVWLKRRTWLNIVVGGLAGSFAVLAGGAAVAPTLGPLPLLMAAVLFLWTPPHFWSLAIANQSDYAHAGVPMLPMVVGSQRAAHVVFAGTVALVVTSLLPAWTGAGPVYVIGAAVGGGYFLYRSWQLSRMPSRATALASFFASLLQLSLVLATACIDGVVR